MEGECKKVPKYEEDLWETVYIVLKSEKNFIEIMPKVEEYVSEIVTKNEENLVVPKSEENPIKIVLKNEQDLDELVIECDEIKWETVTVYAKDLCDSTLPKGLEVKPSNLLGGAMGVFALVKIESDFHFGPYVGERLGLHEKELAFKSEHCWLVSYSLI